MHRINKWKIEKYYWTFPSKLPYIPKEKKKFTTSIRRSLKSYLKEHPSATVDEIFAEFGTVEQLCEDYVDHMTQEQLMNGVKYIRKVNKFLFLLIAVLIILCIGFYTYLYLNAPPEIHYELFDKFLKFITNTTGGKSI